MKQFLFFSLRNSIESNRIKTLLLPVVFLSMNAIAQLKISGRISSEDSGQPISSASVNIADNKYVLTDANGEFRFEIDERNHPDSLQISSIGYEPLKVSVKNINAFKVIKLHQQLKTLNPVVVKTYLTEESAGSKVEVTGFFRSWKTNGTGGEIGRVFYINHDDYKLEKVRFKVNNRCDTCLVRLRIRNYIDDLPGDELLYDSIVTSIKKLDFSDKFSEFDLRQYNIILKQRYIFVGMEVLHCSKQFNNSGSFSFIGTEQGNYWHRSDPKAEWIESDNDYNIYMRLLYKF